jgi:cysteine desulfurase/selenocysteine lyase
VSSSLHECCLKRSEAIRNEFPMLSVVENGHPMVYFNNAATAMTPKSVINAMTEYYEEYGVNIARGVDAIGYRATHLFEATRVKVADFLGAERSDSVVFTRGTTAALNLVCSSFGNLVVEAGDEIIVSGGEHHANYIPWQQLAKNKGAQLVLAELDEDGKVTPEALQKAMTPKTKLVALFHISNVMGAVHDVKALAKVAHDGGAYFVCDGAQGIVHDQINVVETDVDFYAFSGHKLFGPTGVGVLYGKYDLLKRMPPIEFGGEMISLVDVYDTTFADPPHRFEAGTMPIAEVIGLGKAIDYVNRYGYCAMQRRVEYLTSIAVEKLQAQPNVTIYNPHNYASGIICFNIEGIHPHDAAGIYDREGISLRAGHHCSQPMMRELKQFATLRASLAFYNTEEEVERFVEATEMAGDFLDILF